MTLTKRIIACLDVKGGRTVKGVQFEDPRDAGDPAELALYYANTGADEIVFLDIAATTEARGILLEAVRRTARELFVPFTVGGGIRSFEDACAVFAAGADKISINSAAFDSPLLISQIAERFGSQAVVVAVDSKLNRAIDTNEVWLSGGRKPTGRETVSWCREAESRGAGEILLTSMDRDGTRCGFDCDLTSRVSSAVSIPVIASGGAGSMRDFMDVLGAGRADAALAASVFHFSLTPIAELKRALAEGGIAVRWPC